MSDPLTRNECHEWLMNGARLCGQPAVADWYAPGDDYVGTPVCREHAGKEHSGRIVLREGADA